MIKGDESTYSPSRGHETGLVVATLADNERVLALGDVTFLTPPYHTVADNDRFLSHIADWLAGATRQRNLEDFPYLFRGPVDMIQATGDLLDPQLIAGTSEVQKVFNQADLKLTLRSAPSPDHDALFLSTFDDTEPVDKYLAAAGISITLTMTETGKITAPTELGPTTPTTDGKPAEATPSIEATPIATPTLTPTTTQTSNQEVGSLEQSTADEASIDKATDKNSRGIIQIEGLGAIQVEGTSLFIVDRSGAHVVVVALAEDGQALATAMQNLISGDLSKCVEGEPVTVCSTGATHEESGTGTTDNQSSSQNGSSPRIFVLSDDDGPQGKRTGASEFETILSSVYTVTVWSTSRDGIPTSDDVANYDAYIIDSGDYAYDVKDTETLSAFTSVEGSGTMFIGEQPLPLFQPQPAKLDDLAIADATHPIAFGFAADQVITLLPSESDVPAIVLPDSRESFGQTDIVFNRGPNSAEAGRPALLAALNEQTGGHVILASFAFYRLPEEAQRTFALNAVKWLLEK